MRLPIVPRDDRRGFTTRKKRAEQRLREHYIEMARVRGMTLDEARRYYERVLSVLRARNGEPVVKR